MASRLNVTATEQAILHEIQDSLANLVQQPVANVIGTTESEAWHGFHRTKVIFTQIITGFKKDNCWIPTPLEKVIQQIHWYIKLLDAVDPIVPNAFPTEKPPPASQ